MRIGARTIWSQAVQSHAYFGALAASLIGQATLAVSGPITARLLGPTGRGELALISIVVVLIGTLGSAGLPSAVAYSIAHEGASARGVLAILRVRLIQLSVAAGALCIGSLLLLGRVQPLTSVWFEASLGALWVVSAMSWLIVLACLQGEQKFRHLNLLRPFGPIVTAIAMAVLLVLFHRATVPVVLGVVVASNVVACAVGAAVAIRSLRKETQTANLKVGALFSYGMRSLPGTTGPIEAFSLDQVAVGLLLSRSDLGLYVVAGAFNNLPSILVSGVGTIALPRISAERDPTARTRAIRKIGMLSVAMAAATSLVAELLVGSLLPLAFGADFASAVPIARLLILAGLLFAVRRMLVVFLQAVGRPGRTAVGEAASFIVLATLALALVPVWGVIGASIAVISAAGAGNVYLLWALTRADHEAIAAPTAGVGAQPRRSRP